VISVTGGLSGFGPFVDTGADLTLKSSRPSHGGFNQVRFPGSKLLHQWDLATQNVSLEDLLRSCQQIGLTGFAEIKFPESVAMIFYYLGGEVNALYREGPVAYNGQAALDKLREQVGGPEGAISVYELPLDMAHLLRGITNRQRLRETLKGRTSLADFLGRLEKAEHTGTLEIQLALGSAMVLIVRGRVSNVYWEATGGQTYEKGEARQHLDEALDTGEEAMLYLADFSRDVWKSRHEVQDSLRSRLQNREDTTAEELATEENQLRSQILDGLCAKLPSVAHAFLFDLMTGAILARKSRAGSALRVSLLAEKVPAFTSYLRDVVAAENQDRIELIEVSTERVAALVAVVPETLEGIAVLADRAQPTATIGAALTRAVRDYAARAVPQRSLTAPD